MARSYVSMAMLPMEDMEQYLERISGFRKKDDIVEDTKRVGKIESERIAISVNGDRETVKNSTMLGGVEAGDYITKNDSATLLADTHNVSILASNEIKSLRDELYQMKNELLKQGYIKNSDVYNGLVDPFRNGEIRYNNSEITKIAIADGRSSISDITVQDSTDLAIGQYIVIKNLEVKNVVKIKDIQSNRIFIEPSITGPLDETCSIFKTLGIYNKGEFVIGEHKGSVISPVEKQMIIKDGKSRKKIREFGSSNSGFATTMITPISMAGVIRSIKASLAVIGNPGSIKAVVRNSEFEVICESISLSSSMATLSLRELEFKFDDRKDMSELKSGSEYIVELITSYADENNKWLLGGFDEPCLEGIHLDSYDIIDGEHFKSEDYNDMFLAITTSEIETDKLKYYKDGIYTSTVKMSELCQASRVRVELKVNREGRFKVVNNPSTLLPGPLSNIELENTDGKSYGSIGIFTTGTNIAVGNQITKVGENRINNNSFTLNTTTYAPSNSDVYRIGYKVIATAKKTVVDSSNPSSPIKTIRTKTVELPLVGIITGKESYKESISSDRLIFESELMIDGESGYRLLDFNEIEVQVMWSSNGVMEAELQAYPELAGKILDLTVSTDRAYNKLPQEGIVLNSKGNLSYTVGINEDGSINTSKIIYQIQDENASDIVLQTPNGNLYDLTIEDDGGLNTVLK